MAGPVCSVSAATARRCIPSSPLSTTRSEPGGTRAKPAPTRRIVRSACSGTAAGSVGLLFQPSARTSVSGSSDNGTPSESLTVARAKTSICVLIAAALSTVCQQPRATVAGCSKEGARPRCAATSSSPASNRPSVSRTVNDRKMRCPSTSGTYAAVGSTSSWAGPSPTDFTRTESGTGWPDSAYSVVSKLVTLWPAEYLDSPLCRSASSVDASTSTVPSSTITAASVGLSPRTHSSSAGPSAASCRCSATLQIERNRAASRTALGSAAARLCSMALATVGSCRAAIACSPSSQRLLLLLLLLLPPPIARPSPSEVVRGLATAGVAAAATRSPTEPTLRIRPGRPRRSSEAILPASCLNAGRIRPFCV